VEREDAFAALPFALKRDLDRYIANLETKTSHLFRVARVPHEPALVERFLFLAALQKLWIQVNAHAEVLFTTVSTVERATPVDSEAGLRIGRSVYTRSSEEFHTSLALRRDLMNLLRRLEVYDTVVRKRHVDIIRSLGERRPRGRRSDR
jgi:hypothetical protein